MRDDGSRPHRRRAAATAATICVIAVAVGVALLVDGRPDRGAGSAKAVALTTTTVTRTDLVTVSRDHGVLAYASRETVHPAGAGTVTSLPRVGQIVARGSAIWAIDDQPVGVLFGSTPLFRSLQVRDAGPAALAVQSDRAGLLAAQAAMVASAGSHGGPSGAARVAQAQVNVTEAQDRLQGAEQTLARTRAPQQGPDVALVAANMSALGYADGASDTWGPVQQQAVRRWQQQLGAATDGTITPSDVLVVGGPARVGAIQGRVGDPASAVTVSLTSPDRVAEFHMRGGVPAALAVGRRVRLSAAGHSTVGRVASVTGGGGSATVAVDFDQSSPLARVTSTRVTLSVTTSDVRGVLVVPVQALVALASGGEALQLPDGQLIAARTGTERGERIEVSGAGIHDGLRVVSVT